MCKGRNGKTGYPGVYYRTSKKNVVTLYVSYRLGGRGSRQINEPVGTTAEGMTPAEASRIRARRIDGLEKSNRERRQMEMEKEAESSQNGMTFDDVFNRYCRENQGKASIKDDQSRYRNHAREQIGKMAPEQIGNAEIAMIDGAMRDKNLSAQTRKHVAALIARVLRYGEKRELYSLPRRINFAMPKLDNQKTEFMTAAQQAAYLDALDREPNREIADFLRMLMVTGMRKGALLALEWKDCDFENRLVALRGESAKNGKTARIPMSGAAREILLDMRKRGTGKGRIFNIRDNGKNSPLYLIADRIRDEAGLPKDFRPMHGLRHNFASVLASSGKIDMYALQKLLTHSSPAMTQRYAHLADEAMRRAAAVADGIFARQGDNENAGAEGGAERTDG